MQPFVTGLDVVSSLPLIVVCAFGIFALLLEVFQRPSFSRQYIAYVAAFGFLLAGVTALGVGRLDGVAAFSGMSHLDGYTSVMTAIFCLGGGLTALVAPNYLEEQGLDRGEFYGLLLLSVGGMIAMATAGDLVTFFIGLEIMSIAVYALTAFLRSSARSAEAGMKYFFIGAFASGLLLYGIAMIYGATGTTNLAEIHAVLSRVTDTPAGVSLASHDALIAAAGARDAAMHPLTLDFGVGALDISLVHVGVLFIAVAFAVKVAAAPFHMWAPDAYTGAPTPVVGFMAATVKAASFAALVRILVTGFFADIVRVGDYGWVAFFMVVSFVSIVFGNTVAIVQTNVKRMLAYSSVAHAGYMLIGVAAMGFGAGSVEMGSSIVFYALAYTVGTVGAFGAIAYVGRRGSEIETYDDMNGLGFKYPWLGAALAVFMLSSAGIPPAAGFMAKLLVFKAAINASVVGAAADVPGAGMLMTLAVLGIVTSVAGVYYYLKVIVHLYMKKPRREMVELPNAGAKFAIILCALATLWIGMFPGKYVDHAERAMDQMGARPDGVYVQPSTIADDTAR